MSISFLSTSQNQVPSPTSSSSLISTTNHGNHGSHGNYGSVRDDEQEIRPAQSVSYSSFRQVIFIISYN